MNFYGTETRDEHTLSGRTAPLMEAMLRSVNKAGGRVLPNAELSLCLPVWCHRICDEFTKTIFKRLVAVAPKPGTFDAKNYGQIIGMILRTTVFFLKQVPAKLRADGLFSLTKAQDKKLETMIGWPQLFAIASQKFQKPISTEDELIDAGAENLEKWSEKLVNDFFLMLRHLFNQPVETQSRFLFGVAEGFASFIDHDGEFIGKRARYEVFFLLLLYWPEIVEMQKAQPPKTRRDLLEWLEHQEQRQWVDDPKAFFELCHDLGLEMAPPGHPTSNHFA